MTDTAVVWFRRDLRLHDNRTLASAVERADEVLPVYVFDPRQYARSRYVDEPKTGPRRAAFLAECVGDLRGRLRARGGDLLVRRGRPERVLPALAAGHGADAVHAGVLPGTEEWTAERAVRRALDERGVRFERFRTHTLYHPDDLPTPVGSIPDTYTPWRKEVERASTVRDPVEAPTAVPVPDDADPGAIPSTTDLGVGEAPAVDERGVLAFEGGETAALERLREYVWEGDHLRRYKRTRNGLVGADYSSKFSAWLSAGCLSPRYVKREVDRYEAERVANDSTYWLVFELLWRDFFAFQFHKHGADFFRAEGIRAGEVSKEWRRDEAAFRRWADGGTGVPFVDANMRELNATGYMSNRGRQNVASFLTDLLGIDWRWGAAYFESRLVDYDVASNWGNWAYVAGVGNDSRDDYFDVLSQAERYDPDAEYVTRWLPELDGLPPEFAHRPWRMGEARGARAGVELGVDYPEPMVDVEDAYRRL
ncbi:MAG: DASH family cryptochrome [Haloarculaceae archaeon]